MTDIGINCDNAASPAFDAMQKGYSIYTIGLGGGDIRSVDEEMMKRWAKCTGGVYKQADSANALANVYDEIYKLVQGKSIVKKVCSGNADAAQVLSLPTSKPVSAPTQQPVLTPTSRPSTMNPTQPPTKSPTPRPTNKCFASGDCCDSNTSGCCAGLTCKSSGWSGSKKCM
jgi:hypothetical protein